MSKPYDSVSTRGAVSLSDLISILVDHGCPDITSTLDKTQFSEYPVHGGGFWDIYMGRTTAGTKVAVKCARHCIPGDKQRQDLELAAREVHIWSKCDHENVLELYGLVQHRGQLAMVSPWMENGTLPEYIAKEPDVDRLSLCLQITKGLAYLHKNDMTHGDLKGANVLVSSAGVLKLADFGNTKLKEQTVRFSTRTSPVFSVRWAAPEILNGSPCSVPADMYALGMTIYETVTGDLPYGDKADMVVVIEVLTHRRFPPRNNGSIRIDGNKDRLWNLMESCWNHDSLSRPQATNVEAQLTSILSSAQTFVEDPQNQNSFSQPQVAQVQSQPASSLSNRRDASLLQRKSGCVTCRARQKRCDGAALGKVDCSDCIRLNIQCLGFHANRPDWLRSPEFHKEAKNRIRHFLTEYPVPRGRRPTSGRPFLSFQDLIEKYSSQNLLFSGPTAPNPQSVHPYRIEPDPAATHAPSQWDSYPILHPSRDLPFPLMPYTSTPLIPPSSNGAPVPSEYPSQGDSVNQPMYVTYQGVTYHLLEPLSSMDSEHYQHDYRDRARPGAWRQH